MENGFLEVILFIFCILRALKKKQMNEGKCLPLHGHKLLIVQNYMSCQRHKITYCYL